MMMRANSDIMNRFREAAAYQRQAVRCLIPDRMSGHLDVIGNELKLMLTEAAADILKDCVGQMLCRGNLKNCVEQAFCSERSSSETDSEMKAGTGGSGSEKKSETRRSGSRKIDIL